MKLPSPKFPLLGLFIAGVAPVCGGSFSANFNDGLTPAGTQLYSNNGGGVIELTGGAANSGCLKLTKSVNNQSGSLVVEDLDGGQDLNSFTATWKMRLGGGTATPADGVSFCVASGLSGTFGPEGQGSGIRVAFDTFNNGNAEAPAVDIYWNNAVVAHLLVPIATLRTGNNFVDAQVRLDPDGSLDVTYNGQVLYNNYYIPGFFPINSAQFGWGGATGGLNENQFIDDIAIATTTGVLSPGISRAPRPVTVLEGFSGLFEIGVNEGATIQWEKKLPADANYAPIPGATGSSLTTAPVTAADNGALYRASVSLNGLTITSTPAGLTVTTLPPPAAPQLSYQFDDPVTPVPAPTQLRGNALPQPSGGVGGSGYLELTSATNSQNGTWVIPDTRAGATVDGFFAHFRLNMTPTPDVLPADGFGFHFTPNLPGGNLASEVAVGNGLSVCFDVYDNGAGEAPAVDVFYRGAQVASVKYSRILFDTQGSFADVRVRLEPDGTVDVAFNGILAIENLALPSYQMLVGASAAFSARTGGAYQVHAIDAVELTTSLFNGPVVVTQQPVDTSIVQNFRATFTAGTNDPARTTYQWQRREPGGSVFTDIPGATASSYTTPPTVPANDQGAAFRVVLNSSNSTTATSNTAVLSVLNLVPPSAPQVVYNFNSGTLVNTGSASGVSAALSGTSYISTTGGTSNSGVFHITDDVGAQSGGLIISDFNGGASIGSFKAVFAVRSGGAGTPADGWSFSWGSGMPTALTTGDLEQGIGNDLRISFDIYDNTDGNPNNLPPGEAPAIDIFWRGTQLVQKIVPLSLLQTGTNFEQVHIELAPDGKLTVAQDGVPAHIAVQIPDFAGLANARFALAGRTGGAFTNQWVDDLAIQTSPYVGPISFIAQPPATTSIVEGTGLSLSVLVNDPARTTFQWQRKLPGEAEFSNVAGATAAAYDTPALAATESGVQYRAIATATTNTLTSSAITVTVRPLNLPAVPELALNFDDFTIPSDSALYGTATLGETGGIANSSYIQLTSAAGDQTSSFILEDQDAGEAVNSMTAEFYLRITDGSTIPADGVSFSWGTGINNGGIRDDGAGNDLRVSFDTYNNGSDEAPAIELRWRNQSLGNIRVPLTLLMDPEFVQVVVRINADGTCDITYDGEVIFWRTPLPDWAPLAGARYAWGGATGGQFASHSLDNIRLTTTTGDLQVAPSIAVGILNGELVIAFDGALQSSTTTSGWTTIEGAVSPLRIPLSSLTGQPRRFWRAFR